MIIVGIDPGPEKSHYAVCEKLGWESSFLEADYFLNSSPMKNKALLEKISPDIVIIETVKNYGMPMSDEVLTTCRASGALEAICLMLAVDVKMVPRKTIVTSLCGEARAGDVNVKSFLTDYWLPSFKESDLGGGKNKAIGTPKAPGPFFGFRGEGNTDKWAALACATYQCIIAGKVKEDDWL